MVFLTNLLGNDDFHWGGRLDSFIQQYNDEKKTFKKEHESGKLTRKAFKQHPMFPSFQLASKPAIAFQQRQ